jgi:hypothetical protein
MEDMIVIKQELGLSNKNNVSVFAVFDGYTLIIMRINSGSLIEKIDR